MATDKPRVVSYVSQQTYDWLIERAYQEDRSISKVTSKILADALDPDNALVHFSHETMKKLKALSEQKGFRAVEDLIQMYCLKCLDEEDRGSVK